MKIRKIFILMLLILFITTGLSGCTLNKPASSDQAVAESKSTESKWLSNLNESVYIDEGNIAEGQKITLKTVSMFGMSDSGQDHYNAVIEKFKKANPNITIMDDSTTSDEEWKRKIAADFSVGNEPDVLQFFTDAAANPLVATGKLVTIEEIREIYPEYAADSTESALTLAQNMDGVQRAVPTTGYWEGLFINRDLFDQYNVDVPSDWDGLVTAIKIFKENDIVPIACSLNQVPHYWIEFLMLYSAGIDDYISMPEAAPESWIKGLELFQTLRDMGAFPENTDTVDDDYVSRLFNDKKAAMQLDGSWKVLNIEDQENVEVINFPGVPDQKAESGTIISGLSSGFYITRKAWEDPYKREAAVRFVMAHTCKESLEAYWSGIGLPTFDTEPLKDMTKLAASGFAYIQSATNIVEPTDARIANESYKQIVSGIADVSIGIQPADELLNSALKLNTQLSAY